MGKGGFRDTDEFVTEDAAVVFQSFLYADRHLRRKIAEG